MNFNRLLICLKLNRSNHTEGMISWEHPEREFFSTEDRILLVNRSRSSLFCLPNCTLWVNVIFKSAPMKNICDIMMSKPQQTTCINIRKVNKGLSIKTVR